MADEYILKSFDGGAQKTALTSAFTIGGTTLAVSNGSTFPDGSAGPFVVVVDRGLATEEKFLIDTTSGVNSTTFNIQQVAYDGTSASAHASGAIVEHCLDAYSIEQANRYVNLQTAKGDLVSHNGTTTTKVAVGANNTVLTADSTVSAGNKWSLIQSASLASSAVTEEKIASSAVTSTKINDGAVTTTKIADLNVTTGKIADLNVTTAKLADGSVTAAKIAGGAIPTSVPTGIVSPFAGSTSPAGYLLCDGTAVSRTTYADLFAVIGTVYGAGNGSSTFNVPNLKGRVPTGIDTAQSEFNVLGETGGAKTHTLLWNEMPSHDHGVQPHNHVAGTEVGGGGVHNHTFGVDVNAAAYGSSGGVGITTSANDQTRTTNANEGHHGHTITVNFDGPTSNVGTPNATNISGGSAAHNNLQPYIALNYIIKT